MKPQEANSLLLKTFWLMSANIDRIMAQRDMRALTVGVCQQEGESAKQFRLRLDDEVGTIVKTAPAALYAKRDEQGFAELKDLAKVMR